MFPGLDSRLRWEQTGNMPPIETLQRVMRSAGSTLKLRCGKCGHEVEFSRKVAWRLFGMDATPHAIRKRARCGKCGDKALVSVTV
jgi:ribosomal protein S27AE